MENERMEFSVDFFRDEVRCGFYIPTAIKQAWAAGLMVLSEIDKICTRHGITYIADWGTFLGTVRHGGYVPWDDDFDICMKRDDYVRFRAVADQELPSEYVIHDFERKTNHWLFLSRVVNYGRISFEEEHLAQYHNFPYLTGVDIFIQDYLYRDPKKEKARCDEIMYILAVADAVIHGTHDREVQQANLDEIESRYRVRLDRNVSSREMGIALYKLAERQMMRVPYEEADEVGQIFPWIIKGGKGRPKADYEKVIRLPFENTTIPVPASYDKLLSSRYGNYLEIHKAWSGHNYPYFEGQKKELLEGSDMKLPEYEFDRSVLKGRDTHETYKNSIRGIAEDCLSELWRLYRIVREADLGNNYEDMLAALENSQQLAVDLGNLTESVKGADSISCQSVIRVLQNYCDGIYAFSQSNCDVSQLEVLLQETEQVVRKYIIDRKEILFQAAGPMMWRGFLSMYQTAMAEDEADVYVVALPMLFKDVYGRIQASEEELMKAAREEEYPSDVRITPWYEYDVTLHFPSKILIQDVYDGENPCLTVPAQYYAQRVRNYTESLIFVPPYQVGEFTKEDYSDVYNLKHYVTAPGFVYSDIVFVQSENTRERYMEKLLDWAGEDTKDYWEKKLIVQEKSPADETIKEQNARKRLLYIIGVNEVAEYGAKVVEAIRNRMEIMKDAGESLDITVAFYPPQMDTWKMVDSGITEKLLNLVDDYTRESWCTRCDLADVDWQGLAFSHHAYYGSASPIVLMFSQNKKPVMIARYDIE